MDKILQFIDTVAILALSGTYLHLVSLLNEHTTVKGSHISCVFMSFDGNFIALCSHRKCNNVLFVILLDVLVVLI